MVWTICWNFIKKQNALFYLNKIKQSVLLCQTLAMLGHYREKDRSSFWLIRAAVSSVALTLPELMAINWWPRSEKYRSTRVSVLVMMPTVMMAYRPR